jgi:hypothetical protein
MKKYYFMMAAVSAMMLTACSSEDDVLQTGQTKQSAPQEVGFDVYTSAANDVTRAGQAGTMTTNRLQRTEGNGGGFGVYAYLVEDAIAASGDAAANATDYVTWQNRTTPTKAPNFMVNEKVLWNNTNLGWYYNPLKYWPNETDFDSQTTPAEMIGSASKSHLDRLTFFAYAPYVAAGVNEPGITLLTNKKGDLVTDPNSTTTAKLVEASVGYKAALTAPSSSVDLLWGVAPAGGLSYTAVNKYTVSKDEGTPLIDMIKPDVNTSMKFLFQHALARIGINVVAAIDQLGAGGALDANTKITVDEVTLTGKFGETGILNLDNPTANVAHWVDINGTPITPSTASLPTDVILTLNVTNKTIAPDLRYTGPHTFGSYAAQTVGGVTTTKQDLLTGRYYTLDATPAYVPSKKYYSDANGTAAVATYTVTGSEGYYTYNDATDVYTPKATGSMNAPATGSTNTGLFTLTATGVANNAGSCPSGYESTTWYTKDDVSNVYTTAGAGSGIDWSGDGNTTYYRIDAVAVPSTSIDFAYSGTIYDVERNYFMVVPTNNVKQLNAGLDADVEKALRTVRVKIKYYVTTEDSKIDGGRTQIENVIEKDVLFPSLANGKSYMLNLILGLTSVKMEAEVDDWKVINVNADLPQNTAE